MIESPKFCIIGAGVVGLNTALELQNVYPKCNVTILAAEFTINITSHGAAGIFRPGTSFSGPTEKITKQWIVDSFNFYSKLLSDPKSGVHQVSGYILSNISQDLTRNSLIENLVPEYRDTSPEERIVGGKEYKFGSFSKTIVTENSNFLPWAMKKISQNGGTFIQRVVTNFQELDNEFDIVFNCTGLGAKQLCTDRKMVPIRGQVIKIFAPWLKHFYYLDYDVYIIPHSNGIVTLGGCRHYESYSNKINKYDTAAILERCYNLIPQLKQCPILYEWCGLRPHRSEVRVEYETIGRLKVIHNYGHGGYGVTTAPGTSKYAVQICQSILSNSNSIEKIEKSKL